jgi:hypothetical protein
MSESSGPEGISVPLKTDFMSLFKLTLSHHFSSRSELAIFGVIGVVLAAYTASRLARSGTDLVVAIPVSLLTAMVLLVPFVGIAIGVVALQTWQFSRRSDNLDVTLEESGIRVSHSKGEILWKYSEVIEIRPEKDFLRIRLSEAPDLLVALDHLSDDTERKEFVERLRQNLGGTSIDQNARAGA